MMTMNANIITSKTMTTTNIHKMLNTRNTNDKDEQLLLENSYSLALAQIQKKLIFENSNTQI